MQHKGTETLYTEHLILRRFTENDIGPAYRNWCSDPEVTKFLSWPAHKSVEITEKVVHSWIDSYGDDSYYQWAIEPKDAGEAVGSISVVKQYGDCGTFEIGYCLGRKYWGKGYMTEALIAVEDFLFKSVEAEAVCAQHDTRNPASGAVMMKSGMRFEGVRHKRDVCSMGVSDLVGYSITKEQYFAMQKTGRERKAELNCGFSTGKKWFRLRAAGIIIEEGKVLFIGSSLENYLYSVGGAIHMGETTEDAVLREVFEETGVRYEIDRLAVIHENFFDENEGTFEGLECHEVCFYFLMKPKGRIPEGKESANSFGAVEKHNWIPINELEGKRAFPEFLQSWIREMPAGIMHIVSDERKKR